MSCLTNVVLVLHGIRVEMWTTGDESKVVPYVVKYWNSIASLHLRIIGCRKKFCPMITRGVRIVSQTIEFAHLLVMEASLGTCGSRIKR